MIIDDALVEWRSKTRRMGCVAAARWFCKRVPTFVPERLTRYTRDGFVFEHVVVTDGFVRIDLGPYNDVQRDLGVGR